MKGTLIAALVALAAGVGAVVAWRQDTTSARPTPPNGGPTRGSWVPPPPTPGVMVEAAEEARSQWEGFGPGTFAIFRITGKETSILQRITVVKLEGDHVSLQFEQQGAPTSTKSVRLREPMKRIGAETLDVDGRTFACTVYEKHEGDSIIKAWMSKAAPGRIVKMEQIDPQQRACPSCNRPYEPHALGCVPCGRERVVFRGSGRLVKLHQRREVNKVPVTYAIFEFEASGADEKYRATITRWISEEVPGFVVREESRVGSSEKVKVKELVEFEVK